MHRIAIAAVVLVALAVVAQTNSASAAIISRNNPYRSFNVSGVNYASMQWQRKYGNSNAGKNWSNGRSNGRWFRRR
jgi:hypothetical protein